MCRSRPASRHDTLTGLLLRSAGQELLEQALASCRRPLRDAPLHALSGSIGAVLCGPGDDADAVIALADRAMYDAKSLGGNRWVHGGSPAVLPDQRPAPQRLRVG